MKNIPRKYLSYCHIEDDGVNDEYNVRNIFLNKIEIQNEEVNITHKSYYTKLSLKYITCRQHLKCLHDNNF